MANASAPPRTTAAAARASKVILRMIFSNFFGAPETYSSSRVAKATRRRPFGFDGGRPYQRRQAPIRLATCNDSDQRQNSNMKVRNLSTKRPFIIQHQ